ncbi:hypothetical protein EYS14_09280 [Alteromonadaceae bacterium M269]|nr:hypothetical protein EYS14_09280 [Alteromonadaceae bacterium M269]
MKYGLATQIRELSLNEVDEVNGGQNSIYHGPILRGSIGGFSNSIPTSPLPGGPVIPIGLLGPTNSIIPTGPFGLFGGLV